MYKIKTTIFTLLFLSSCSLISSNRKGVSESTPTESSTVSKEEYDKLKMQYEALLAEKNGVVTIESTPPVIMENSAVIGETVTLSENQNKNDKIEKAILTSLDMEVDEKDIEKETKLFKMAYNVYKEKDYNKALKMLQNIEKSNYPQVQVRAKFYIAEIFFIQKEYDLAMQIYEEIVEEKAFSGLVLPSLERLTVCAKELDLNDKLNRYQSLMESLLGRKT